MQKQEYKQLVKTSFVSNEDSNYNLMRAGLELAEEFLELHYYTLVDDYNQEEELNELGDVYFWLTFMAEELGFDLESPKRIPDDPLVCCKNIVGSIKRFYRDRNSDKLIELPTFINNMLNSLMLYYDCSEEELIEVNSEKLTRRLANNTICGEGER